MPAQCGAPLAPKKTSILVRAPFSTGRIACPVGALQTSLEGSRAPPFSGALHGIRGAVVVLHGVLLFAPCRANLLPHTSRRTRKTGSLGQHLFQDVVQTLDHVTLEPLASDRAHRAVVTVHTAYNRRRTGV